MLLNINKISKYINDKLILDEVSLKLYKNDRTALIGANGAGKTTLLKIITGEYSADGGNIECLGKIGYLPQSLSMEGSKTVEEFLKPYEINPDYPIILKSFKLADNIAQRIETLSGGEKTRLYLSGIILSKPDILILDEPTNHLDYDGIIWLEHFISSFDGSVLIVSHDRYFLDKVTDKTIELENTAIKEYSGNYSFYRKSKEQEFQSQMLQYTKYVKAKRQLEEAARKQMERANRYNNMSQNDYYRGKAAKIAKRSKAIISRLNQMDRMEKPKEGASINISFGDSIGKSGNILLRAENIEKAYDKTIFKNLSFDIRKKSKIAIVGPNGIGKSTLLKAIAESEEISGNLYISSGAKIGYFSQELTNLNEELTLLEELKIIDNDESNLRILLGSMLFKADDVYKKVGNLSYGEKVRLIFLKLALGDYNFLILDEPTNFLDISSREKIEEVLMDFQGAILFVSHDRYFIKKIAKEIWEMGGETITKYLGDYDYYLNKKKENQNPDKKSLEERILMLQMELSAISFKLFGCKEEEKEALEKEYFSISDCIKELRNLQ